MIVRILIVEDAPTQQLAMTAMVRGVFNSDAEEVIVVGTLREAQEAVAKKKIHLAILDLQLDTEPMETIAGFPFHAVATLVLTAMDHPSYGRRALRAGAMYYFRKPLEQEDWDIFGAAAETAMRNHALQADHARLCRVVDDLEAMDCCLKKVVEEIKPEGAALCQGIKTL